MIEYFPLQRSPEAFQVSVPLAQLLQLCTHAFGQQVRVKRIQELGNGQFNTTYLVSLHRHAPVILRVAPPSSRCRLWHESHLMRREVTMHSLLAPLGGLLPRLLVADFSHSLIDRDYLFQTFIDGQSWVSLPADLSLQEHDTLWCQFARLVKAISRIRGEAFGLVQGASLFSSWSLTLLDWLERTYKDAQQSGVDVSAFGQLLSLAQSNAYLFDQVTEPRLLHGDLWWFNLLLQRTETGPRIVALLDADRGAWGDPLADWTFFLLQRRASAREQALFWNEYGLPPHDRAAQFRAKVYEGLHHGKILSVATRDRKEKAVLKAADALKHVVCTLQGILAGEGEGKHQSHQTP